jgi:hypothetical protein
MTDTLVTIAPDAVVAANGWTVGASGGTIQANLADALDSTYAWSGGTAGATALYVSLANPVIPAGAVITKVNLVIRGYPAFNGSAIKAALLIPATSTELAEELGATTPAISGGLPIDKSGPVVTTRTPVPTNGSTPVQRALTVADLNALQLVLTPQGPVPGTGEWFIVRAYVNVYYNMPPTVVTTVSETTIAPRPLVSWVYADTEGEAQEAYEVKVFTAAQFGAAGFSPDTSSPLWTSGQVAGSATSARVGTDLANGVTYRAYARAKDAGSHNWSPWVAAADFVPAVPLPATPELTAVADAVNSKVTLTIQGLDNGLSKTSADLDTTVGVADWIVLLNCTLAVDTVAGDLGVAGALRMTSTGGGTMTATVAVPAQVPCLAGVTYAARASFKQAVGLARNTRVGIRWFNAAGALLSTSAGGVITPGAGGFSEATILAVAPAGATKCAPYVEVVGPALNEQWRIDQIGLTPAKMAGTLPASWTRGGITATQRIKVERSDDGGVTWATVPGLSAVDLTDATQQLVVVDYTAPYGSPRYRASSYGTDGAYTLTSDPSAVATVTLAATAGVTWLKDITDPTRNRHVSLTGDAWESSKRERVVFFEFLGRTKPVPYSGGMLGNVFPVVIQAFSEAEWQAIELLRESGRTLLLQTDMPGQQWWVRFGPELSRTLARSVERLTKPYRRLAVQLVEVDAPA